MVACDVCHGRKTRCDGALPCWYCKNRHLECTYDREQLLRGRGGDFVPPPTPPMIAERQPSTSSLGFVEGADRRRKRRKSSRLKLEDREFMESSPVQAVSVVVEPSLATGPKSSQPLLHAEPLGSLMNLRHPASPLQSVSTGPQPYIITQPYHQPLSTLSQLESPLTTSLMEAVHRPSHLQHHLVAYYYSHLSQFTMGLLLPSIPHQLSLHQFTLKMEGESSLLIFALYAFTTQYAHSHHSLAAANLTPEQAEKYLNEAVQLVPGETSKPDTLSTAQSMILLAMTCSVRGNLSAASLYFGIAVRMARSISTQLTSVSLAMGLDKHRTPIKRSSSLSPSSLTADIGEREGDLAVSEASRSVNELVQLERLWMCLYQFDRIMTSAHPDRPLSIPDSQYPYASLCQLSSHVHLEQDSQQISEVETKESTVISLANYHRMSKAALFQGVSENVHLMIMWSFYGRVCDYAQSLHAKYKMWSPFIASYAGSCHKKAAVEELEEEQGSLQGRHYSYALVESSILAVSSIAGEYQAMITSGAMQLNAMNIQILLVYWESMLQITCPLLNEETLQLPNILDLQSQCPCHASSLTTIGSLCVFSRKLLYTPAYLSSLAPTLGTLGDIGPQYAQPIETPFKLIPHHLCQVFFHGLLICLIVLNRKEFSLRIHEEGGYYEALMTCLQCLAGYWTQAGRYVHIIQALNTDLEHLKQAQFGPEADEAHQAELENREDFAGSIGADGADDETWSQSSCGCRARERDRIKAEMELIRAASDEESTEQQFDSDIGMLFQQGDQQQSK